jgi:hypothetical protein
MKRAVVVGMPARYSSTSSELPFGTLSIMRPNQPCASCLRITLPSAWATPPCVGESAFRRSRIRRGSALSLRVIIITPSTARITARNTST